MMRFIFLLAFSLWATSPALAQHVHNPIPWVESVVSSMTSVLKPAVTYAGPTGNASIALKTSTAASVFVAAATPAATSYWLETIKHQGISAFNANPGSYQVFRNVKSFGAKGMPQIFSLTSSLMRM
jgi:glucan 1,3-beta-glucosidase